jgi:hypothetical protein
MAWKLEESVTGMFMHDFFLGGGGEGTGKKQPKAPQTRKPKQRKQNRQNRESCPRG